MVENNYQIVHYLGTRDIYRIKCKLTCSVTHTLNWKLLKELIKKDYKPQFHLFKKQCKRIETLFPQLCDQFMIRGNYAKSFEGFKTRLFAKITALTVVQFINKVYFNRNINNLKVSII